MTARLGYARVSTNEQNPQLQIDALQAAGVDRVFIDYASGTTTERPQLHELLDYARTGDTILIWRLDRLGRSLRDLLALVDQLHEQDIGLISVTEAIDTTSATGELVFNIFATIAQFERALLAERTAAGLTAAKARGRRGGRPTVMTPQRIEAAHRLRGDGMTMRQVAATLGVGESTLYRALSA